MQKPNCAVGIVYTFTTRHVDHDELKGSPLMTRVRTCSHALELAHKFWRPCLGRVRLVNLSDFGTFLVSSLLWRNGYGHSDGLNHHSGWVRANTRGVATHTDRRIPRVLEEIGCGSWSKNSQQRTVSKDRKVHRVKGINYTTIK